MFGLNTSTMDYARWIELRIVLSFRERDCSRSIHFFPRFSSPSFRAYVIHNPGPLTRVLKRAVAGLCEAGVIDPSDSSESLNFAAPNLLPYSAATRATKA